MDKKSLIWGILLILCAFVWVYVDYTNGIEATIGIFNVPQGLTVVFLIWGLVKLDGARKKDNKKTQSNKHSKPKSQ